MVHIHPRRGQQRHACRVPPCSRVQQWRAAILSPTAIVSTVCVATGRAIVISRMRAGQGRGGGGESQPRTRSCKPGSPPSARRTCSAAACPPDAAYASGVLPSCRGGGISSRHGHRLDAKTHLGTTRADPPLPRVKPTGNRSTMTAGRSSVASARHYLADPHASGWSTWSCWLSGRLGSCSRAFTTWTSPSSAATESAVRPPCRKATPFIGSRGPQRVTTNCSDTPHRKFRVYSEKYRLECSLSLFEGRMGGPQNHTIRMPGPVVCTLVSAGARHLIGCAGIQAVTHGPQNGGSVARPDGLQDSRRRAISSHGIPAQATPHPARRSIGRIRRAFVVHSQEGAFRRAPHCPSAAAHRLRSVPSAFLGGLGSIKYRPVALFRRSAARGFLLSSAPPIGFRRRRRA